MGPFQKIVLMIAVVILIIALLVIGLALHGRNGVTWPPIVSSCPDWWIVDGSGNQSKCINVKNLGVCKPTSGSGPETMDFNAPVFTGSQGACNKYRWANRCQVSWDGITYGVNNPCS